MICLIFFLMYKIFYSMSDISVKKFYIGSIVFSNNGNLVSKRTQIRDLLNKDEEVLITLLYFFI